MTLCFAVACGPGISQPGDDASAGTEDSSGTGMTSVGPGTIGEDTTQGPMTSAGPSTTSPGDTSVGPSTDDGPSTGDKIGRAHV